MSKLFKLREWLTISETALHLSNSLKEPVTEADIYRLGLEGHLTLSVNFIHHAEAYRGKLVPLSEAIKVPGIQLPPGTPPYEVALGVHYGEDKIIQFADEINERQPITLDGVFDLAMIGAERFDCETKFQMLTGGVPVELVSMDGTFVKNYDGSIFYSILEEITPQKFESKPFKKIPATYMPANGLPEDSIVVVRTVAIKEFETSLKNDDKGSAKELGNRERNTLLKLIGGLAMDGYGMDIHATRLDKMAEMVNALASCGVMVDEDTLRKHLKAAAELIPNQNRIRK
ncbi:MAG: hypothetical protein Q7K13_07170 [Polynucleobacter sp.]|uniref:hypothetical protein n=1 Tax=Polynucleobacter sp. TaxID=2029855 RepID=UPI00271B55FB|nr:hypothetical protein [Polynucleobacter sp.]MDO8714241.1 hypothetical protein [Polynucleobacter sp.]